MDNLNILAKEYKQNKSQSVLNQIFKLISPALKKKATYVFYKQQFIKEKFEISVLNKKTKTYKKEERVKCFRLCDTKKVELEDIEQELYLEVLELLKKYNERKPFENYLFGTLKNWRPSYIQDVNFIQSLSTQNESELPAIANRQQTLDNMLLPSYMNNQESELDDLFFNLTKEEKKFINLRLKNPQKNQSELAALLGVTQQWVSQILINLKKKRTSHL